MGYQPQLLFCNVRILEWDCCSHLSNCNRKTSMIHLSRNSFNFVKPTNSSIQVDGKSTFFPFLWIARYMFKFQRNGFLALSNLCIQNATLFQQIVAVGFLGIGKQSISKSLSPTIATNNSSNVSHREIRPFVCVRLPTYATVSQLLYVLQ
jgi:hypothetical protein